MAIKGGRPIDRRVSTILFVPHGAEERAIAFYRDALGARELLRYKLLDGGLSGADLQIGDSIVTIAGANPRRDADPKLGGPCSPDALGATSSILQLYVDDVDSAINRAVEAGARIRNPVENAYWGDRVGAITDPFGHIWSLATVRDEIDANDLPPRWRSSVEKPGPIPNG
jgi:PhnB protein